MKAAIETIGKIADRAVKLYDKHNIEVDRQNVILDITVCHFGPQRLRLEDLLAADDFNFLHDVAGINRHLDRDSNELRGGFSPRFSHRRAA